MQVGGCGGWWGVRQHAHSRAQVRQMTHWMPMGAGFFEPLVTPADLHLLPSPAWVAWSRHPAEGVHAIPFRGGLMRGGSASFGSGGGGGCGMLLGLSRDEVRATLYNFLPKCASRTGVRRVNGWGMVSNVWWWWWWW